MLYLFFQTWAWIIGAFILGLLCGWWICGRCSCSGSEKAKADTNKKVDAAPVKKKTVAKKKAPAKKAALKAEDMVVDAAWKPKGFTKKPKDADNLKLVKGIGPVIEKTLNGLGIYQFKQIAGFDKDNIAWVNKHISFVGRIEREEWVSQAKKLAKK